MRPINLAYFAGAVLLSCLMLSPYLWHWQPILNENYMFRTWFVTGVYSGLRLENSFQWVSNIAFGQSRLGNPLFGSLYLPAYLGAYLNQPTTSYIVWLTSMSLGFVGSWKLFSLFTERRELAFLAGTAFVLAGVLFNNSIITLYAERIMFVPWTIFFFWTGVRDDKVPLIVLGAVIHALHFLASTSFTWFYVSAGMGFFLVGYFLHHIWSPQNKGYETAQLRKVFKIGVVFFGLCALLITVQILPILEFDPLAVHREQTLSQYVSTGRLSPRTMFGAQFWFPGAFGDSRQLFFYSNLSYLGWIPLFLVVLWASSTPRKQVIYVGLLLLCILLASANMSPLKEIIRALPGMATVRFSSFWMLAWNFVILILAVKAGERLSESTFVDKARKVAFVLLAVNAVTALSLYYLKDAQLSVELLRPLIIGCLICILFVSAKKWNFKTHTILLTMAFVALLDSSTWAIRTVNSEMVPRLKYVDWINDLRAPQPGSVLQVGGQGQGRAIALCSNDGQASASRLLVSGSNLEWALTFSSYSLKRSYAIERRLGYTQSSACERQAVRMSADDFFTPDRLTLTRALNIRYFFLEGQENIKFVEALGFKFITHDAYSGFDMYEDALASRRALWFPYLQEVKNVEDALIAFDTRLANSQSAIVEFGADGKPKWMENLSGDVSKTADYTMEYHPTKVVLSGKSERPGILVLSDVYYPGWEVSIDGEEAKIFPANIVGRGVYVPAGEHVVTFEYRPWLIWLGMILSTIAWMGVAMYGLICLREWRSKQRHRI